MQTYLSHRNDLIPEDTLFPLNEPVRAPVKHFTSNSAILENGEELTVYVVLCCTGYSYSFPFLSEECRPRNMNGRLYPLYKHVIHTDYPTLYCLGICQLLPHFRLNNLQIEFCVAALLGKAKLPNREGMLQDIETDYHWRTDELGLPPSHAHHIWPFTQFLKPYQEELIKLVDDPKLLHLIPEENIDFIDRMMIAWMNYPKNFRTRNYPLGKVNWQALPGWSQNVVRIGQQDSKTN